MDAGLEEDMVMEKALLRTTLFFLFKIGLGVAKFCQTVEVIQIASKVLQSRTRRTDFSARLQTKASSELEPMLSISPPR